MSSYLLSGREETRCGYAYEQSQVGRLTKLDLLCACSSGKFARAYGSYSPHIKNSFEPHPYMCVWGEGVNISRIGVQHFAARLVTDFSNSLYWGREQRRRDCLRAKSHLGRCTNHVSGVYWEYVTEPTASKSPHVKYDLMPHLAL